MTFIVALACENGVVMGADGTALLSNVNGALWGREPSGDKVRTLGPHVLWAATGDVSEIQAADAMIQRMTEEDRSQPLSEIARGMADVLSHLHGDTAQRYRRIYDGLQVPRIPSADFLFAGWDGRITGIAAITSNGDLVWADEVGYAMDGMDYARHLALPALRRIPCRGLTVDDGCRTVHGVLRDVVDCVVGGVGEPVTVWSLSDDGPHRWWPSDLRS